MKKLFKYIGYLAMSSFAVMSLYLVNLFLMKPYSIDHYLAKELTVSLLDSPEYMTYIGIFDPFNAILKHNQKLSIDTLEDDESNYQDTLKHLEVLKKYNPDNLTDAQKVTQKIAILILKIPLITLKTLDFILIHLIKLVEITLTVLNL